MKATVKDKAKQLNWTFIITFWLLVIGVLLLITQSAYPQNVSDEKRRELINKRVKEQEEMFDKVSSTDLPSDPGNRMVAVRRIRFIFEDLDSKGHLIKNKKDLIEVEVFSKVNIPVTNSLQYLIIGDKAFPEPPRSGDNQTVFVHLTPEEFAQIKDGAIVSYVISGGFLDDTWIKEQYKEGEPKQITGAKFGRIDKTLINQFGVIEEDNDAQRLRIGKTVNRVQ